MGCKESNQMTDTKHNLYTSSEQRCAYPCRPLQIFLVYQIAMIVCFFVFVALRPMSTAMVIAGRSVHLTTLFPGQA